ncbi:MAG: hypothetical protein ACON5H_01860, partial [Akkermansiaceae bacterium]
MKLKKPRGLFTLTATLATAGLAQIAGAAQGSFLTLTGLTADDVDVIAQTDATAGANGVTFVDTDGAGTTDDGVYKITADTTWTADKTYILTRKIFVDAGVTLTIEAGTKIYSTSSDVGTAARADDEFGSIVVTRGGKINANGTADEPIIMSSIEELEAARGVDIDTQNGVATAPTRFDRGLWGGLVILGNAKVYNYSAAGAANLIGENQIEGFAPAFSPDGDADGRVDLIEYGGSNDADDSGTLRYVSIRHGGYEFAAGDEINGLTLGGVGSGTTLEFIEVFANSDDGIEFFGGTANIKNALVSFCKDDGFDLDEGYTGKMQYLAVFQNPTGDNSMSTSVQDSDHGGEWDGNNKGDANDFKSAPIIANLTFIGDNEGDHAFKIDDFFSGEVYNSAATGFADLLTVSGDNTLATAPVFENVTTDVANSVDDGAVETLIDSDFNKVADVMLGKVDIANGSYDPRPASGSPLLGATVTDMAAKDAFFENTTYQGAFGGESNWAAGWTRFSALGHFDFGGLSNLGADDVDLLASAAVTFDPVLGVNVLNGDQTLDASKNYILTDKLFVTEGNTLTIPAGTKIYNTFNDLGTAARADDQFGSIVVSRGSKIEATGTAADPIIMTAIAELEAARSQDIDGDGSVAAAPTRFDRGLWGGLVILGNAKVYNYSAAGAANLIGENQIEGFAPAFAPDADADGRIDVIEYGGNDDADNSGTLHYVSIRHGGYEFAAGDEINGLTLGGVGSGTTLEFIEVFSNSDDGIEFFGGTADIKNALVAFCKDDGLDLDEGYTGRMQFLTVVQNPTGDNSAGTSVQDSDHGGEWDGNNKGDANDFKSAPKIANLTFIGDNEGDHAFKIDDFFSGEVYNSAATGFADLLTVSGDNTLATAPIFDNVTTDVPNSVDDGAVETLIDGDFNKVADIMLGKVDIANASYDPRPASGSPLLGATVTDMAAMDAWFTNTTYQGAFDGESNWAAGWTRFSALGHFDFGGLVNLDTDDVDLLASAAVTFDPVLGVNVLNGDQTLDASKTYILTDKLFVTEGNTLTIPAGTKIYNTFNDLGTAARADDEFGSIVVARGSKIEANGTAAEPIVMTAIAALEAERGQDIDADGTVSLAPTRFDRGLWGGLVILGNAKVYNYSAAGAANLIGENQIEGFAPAFAPDADADGRIDVIEYGGNDDTDNSGTLRYVSIRHGGYEFAAGDEINGLTLGGVGNGTTLEFIEVMSNSDDGIEFFGGTADIKNAIVAFCKDDGFDLDEGYTGRMQYLVVIQNPTGDNSAGTSVQDSDHGGEWDGNAKGDANDFKSAPIIANLTFIGDNEGDHAFKIDDFFSGEIYNSAATGFADLLTVSGDNTLATAPIFENVTTDVPNSVDDGAVETLIDGDFNKVADIMLTRVDIANASYDPRPAAGSPLLGATVTDMEAKDAWFTNTTYQGAFDGTTNWAAGWTGLDELGVFAPALVPADEFQILTITLDAGNMTITFGSTAGESYKVTSSPDLETALGGGGGG